MKTFLLIIGGLALYILFLLAIQSHWPDEEIVVAHGRATEQIPYGFGWTVKHRASLEEQRNGGRVAQPCRGLLWPHTAVVNGLTVRGFTCDDKRLK